MLDQTPEITGKALWRINPCQKRFTASSTRPQCHPSQLPSKPTVTRQRKRHTMTKPGAEPEPNFGSTIDARPDSGEYWKGVMEDQPMPEAIHNLLHQASASPLSTTTQTDCHTSMEATHNDETVKAFVKDFEPRPSLTGYHDDSTKLTGEKSFANDFEPRPNISAYRDNAGLEEKKSFAKDFEPRPNVSVYHDDAGLKGEKSFVKDFEPRPNVSVYQG